ncbi:hypothetical protein IT568_04635 [bacterium]|nr:hypothetical protein [bacterium]
MKITLFKLLLVFVLINLACAKQFSVSDDSTKTEIKQKNEKAHEELGRQTLKQQNTDNQLSPQNLQQTDENIVVVQTEGEAKIYAEDLVSAKDQAITAAKKEAVSLVHGTKIDSEIRLVDAVLVDYTIKNTANGLVKSYKILEEKAGNDVFTVKIESSVYKNTEKISDEFRRNFTAIVGIGIILDGNEHKNLAKANRVENLLIKDLFDEGFEIQKKEILFEKSELTENEIFSLQNKQAGNEKIALKLGNAGFSNLVIYGKAVADKSESYDVSTYQNFGGSEGKLIFYRATLNLTILEVSTQKVIAEINVGGIEGKKSASTTEEKAAFKSIEKCYQEAKPQIIEKLRDYKGEKSKLVTIKITNIPTYEDYKVLKKAFDSIRFKNSEIEENDYSNKVSAFTFYYSENISYIATKFDNYENLSLTEKTKDTITFNYLKQR